MELTNKCSYLAILTWALPFLRLIALSHGTNMNMRIPRVLVDRLPERCLEALQVPSSNLLLLHTWNLLFLLPNKIRLDMELTVAEAFLLVDIHIEYLEAPQVLDAIKYTIGALPQCLCVTIYSEVLKPRHSPCFEHQARQFIPELKLLKIWERGISDANAFFWSMIPDVHFKVHQRGQAGKNLCTILPQRHNLNFQASEILELSYPIWDHGEGTFQHMQPMKMAWRWGPISQDVIMYAEPTDGQ